MNMIFGAQAPVHTAEQFQPLHDGRFHLLEARRGRGKSYGMTYWAYRWFVDRLPLILAGKAPYSKVIANFRIDHHRFALLLCTQGHMHSFQDALDLVHERVIYARDWEPYFLAYECGLFLDEANRSLDAYQRTSSPVLKLAHDWHQQTRKHRNTLVYATQYVDWINTQTRKLFDLLWRAKVVRHKSKRGPDGLRVPLRFNYYGSDPYSNGVDATVVRRADFKMVIPFMLDVARCYGSWEPIVTLSGEISFPWASFSELAAHMQAQGLKPQPSAPPRDRLSIHRAMEAGELGLWTPEGPTAPVSAAHARAPRAGELTLEQSAPLPPPLDLSGLPTSFPRRVL